MSSSYLTGSRVPKPNHNAVAEYLQSGIPYVTSSHVLGADEVVQVSFPTVSRWFVVHNTDHGGGNHALRIGFTENGVNGVNGRNYYLLHAEEQTSRFEIKTKDVFVRGPNGSTFSLIAGLTGIPSSNFPTLTGSLEENGVKVLPGVG